jgi:microsomal dipeptidase-like Zn-dependent dipeptidase
MRGTWGRLRRATALVCVSAGIAAILAGCELIANEADKRLNGLADTPLPTTEENAYNRQFMIIDLHADTLMWRRGLADRAPTVTENGKAKPIGQVDLQRMVEGNVGLQVLTMPTRVPTKNDALRCTDANGSDPAPLLAMAGGWSPAAWGSPYRRALEQAQRLEAAAKRPGPPSVKLIKTHKDLEDWLKARFAPRSAQDRNRIGVLLGAEGAHAFSADLGQEFETLYGLGLRLVGPMHHFTNVYGGSSEGCETVQLGLTAEGKRLVRTMFSRDMIVDVAHASSRAIEDSVAIAQEFRQPLLVSHTGIRNYLKRHRQLDVSQSHIDQAVRRAISDKEIGEVAGTGGAVGVIYWEDQIGAAKVENIVGSITQAYCDLKSTGSTGFWQVKDASEHVALGSDWDGAAFNAIGADGVAAVTAGLCKAGFTDAQVANIAGLNACRVIAQRLSGGRLDYGEAHKLCRSSLPPSLRSCDGDKKPRTVTCPPA